MGKRKTSPKGDYPILDMSLDKGKFTSVNRDITYDNREDLDIFELDTQFLND